MDMEGNNRVAVIELEVMSEANRVVYHPTLIWDKETAILIDAGLPKSLPQLKEKMEDAGVPFNHLQAIILTHQDLDHLGGVPEVIAAQDQPLKIYAHELEKPYIEGELPLIKTDITKVSKEELASMPETVRNNYINPPKVKVTHLVADRQLLPYYGGIEIIFTPGHSPGHISLYHRESKTLIAGDAMVCRDGELKGPNKTYTPDPDTAIHSLKRFLEFDIDTVICYHGGLCTNQVNEQIKNVVNQGKEALFVM